MLKQLIVFIVKLFVYRFRDIDIFKHVSVQTFYLLIVYLFYIFTVSVVILTIAFYRIEKY